MTTIKDVAKYAEVSVATVSRVLNDRGYASAEARRRVLDAIEELNYQPNSVARSLYHKTSGMIGLFMPDITNPFFPELARAVEDVALEAGYTVVFCNTDEEEAKEKRYFDALKQKYVDGIILTASSQSASDYAQWDMPIVALDRVIGKHIPTVASDNKNGARQATIHLAERGCSFIAHLKGPAGVRPADDRAAGFEEVVKEKGLRSVVVQTNFSIKEAEQETLKLLADHPDIDGIFAASDVTAAGAMQALAQTGRSVPGDVKVIGFDGIPLCNMLVPSLTTVQQSIYQMGEKAAQLLIQQIEHGESESREHIFPVSLIIRETT
ncbi:LacI family DNA-binding transcriptional regulator [Salisediminibacterium halotolerans]|uniref:LacI family transcriptional regulator n=1 Tax=Salisediminibacterium halotolerans TaxID=517425 RepID=A0A1H9U9E1_9BACI|nr:LacI family DNA-binding transcriptional regulator [Salisediminibacterium haloalkalitolerans]SES06095.1 LacI family transcriptional regulator [Salisediminibacterium haloalkalitolerans]